MVRLPCEITVIATPNSDTADNELKFPTSTKCIPQTVLQDCQDLIVNPFLHKKIVSHP